MSTKMVTASSAVELTEKENGSVSITVTPLEPSVDYFAPLATETLSDILETILTHLSVEQSISENHLRYRC